ncbi:MAG: His/Gly/Thr/Pro-type tRNA ligase C-terminal domain-containing protein, partial [Verrucomicrobiota bacterium]
DRKAIQAGTSHFLGQNFARASGIKFLSRNNTEELAWTTSWGVSTRLIGTLLMAHGDDDGAVLPPRIAGTQIIIIPITPKEETRAAVLAKAEEIASTLRSATYAGEALRIEIDSRDIGGGTKTWEWIKKGVPLRIEIGPRDLESGSAAVARRDKGPKEKEFLPADSLAERLPEILGEIQQGLLDRAMAFRKEHTKKIDTKEEFYEFFTPKNQEKPEIHGGFALTHWNGSAEVEAKIKEELKVTIRCIPEANGDEFTNELGICPFTGEPSPRRVIFGKAY